MRKIREVVKGISVLMLIFGVPLIGVAFLSLNSMVIGDKSNDKEKELSGDITFVSNRTDKRDEINALIGEFEKIYPKVNVNLELIGDAEIILQRKAAVGELADVTLMPAIIDRSEYQNYFLDISDLGFSENDIYNYNMGRGTDGKIYTLCSSVTWNGIIYNKEIFRKANIETVPRTIDELFEACEKIKKLGVTPIALNYKQTWTMGAWMDSIIYMFDKDLEKNLIVNKRSLFDNDSGIYKAVNLAREIVQRNYCEENLLDYDWQLFKNDMSQGKIAMAIWSSSFINQLVDMGMSKENIGMFPIPETDNVRILGDYRFAVAKNSKNPEVAKEFLRFIFEEDRYAKAVNILSPLKKSPDNIAFFKDLEKYEIPIVYYDDLIDGKDEQELGIQGEFVQLKNINGLDATFVQQYIIENDIEAYKEKLEKQWNNSLNQLKN